MDPTRRIEDYTPANIKGNPVRAWLDRDKSEFEIIDDDPIIKEPKEAQPAGEKPWPKTNYRIKKRLLKALLDIEKSYIWLRPTKKFYLNKNLSVPIETYRDRLHVLIMKTPYNEIKDVVRAFENKDHQLISDIIHFISKKNF